MAKTLFHGVYRDIFINSKDESIINHRKSVYEFFKIVGATEGIYLPVDELDLSFWYDNTGGESLEYNTIKRKIKDAFPIEIKSIMNVTENDFENKKRLNKLYIVEDFSDFKSK